jgi:hypothetical protein
MHNIVDPNNPLFLSHFNTLISSTDFGRILKYQILRKTVQWEPSFSMRKHGWTDRQVETNNISS